MRISDWSSDVCSSDLLFANYLQINFVPGTGELAVILGAVIGAGLGFLWFNAPPAAIFMGDTGSLALGGLIGSVAVAPKHEIAMVIIGGLFVEIGRASGRERVKTVRSRGSPDH